MTVGVVDLGEQSILDRAMKELFSLFILAAVEHVEKVTGKTVRRPDPLEGVADENHPRVWENQVFEDLASIAVEAGITTSMDEARALVIPAFAWYGLLPPEESSDAEANAAPAG